MSIKKTLPTYSFVIPCYNEAANLPLLFQHLLSCHRIIPNIEYVLVDNGSQDSTGQLLKRFSYTHQFVRIVSLPRNAGYGGGIVAGLKKAKGKYIGWLHADLQTPPETTVQAVKLHQKQKDKAHVYVKGRRHGRFFIDWFFTFSMGLLASLVLGQSLFDINAQPSLFPRLWFRQWSKPPTDFSLDLYAFYVAQKQHMTILRFPVVFQPRMFGTSKWNNSWKNRKRFIMRNFQYIFLLHKEGER